MLDLHLNRPISLFRIHNIQLPKAIRFTEFFMHVYAANTIVADVLVIWITWASARMLTKVWQADKSTYNFHLI